MCYTVVAERRPIVDCGSVDRDSIFYSVVLDECTVHGVRGHESVAVATQRFTLVVKKWYEIFWQLWAICSLRTVQVSRPDTSVPIGDP